MHVFIMPTVLAGRYNARTPKYASSLGPNYQTVYYGPDPVVIALSSIGAVDAATLAANSDVIAYPEDNLGTVDAGDVFAFKSAHEAFNLPGDAIAADVPYVTVVRRMINTALLATKMKALGEIFRSIGFDDPLSAYSSAQLLAWRSALLDQGIDALTVDVLLTLREAMHLYMAQKDETSIAISPFTI